MELGKAQQALSTLLQQRCLPQVVLFYGREGMPADDLLTWLLTQLLCQQGDACGARKRQEASKTSEAGARKRQGVFTSEAGARKRQGVFTSEAGARKRQGVFTSEAGARKRQGVFTSEAGARKRQGVFTSEAGARKRQGVFTSEASDICAACHALAHNNHNDVLHCDAERESFGVAEVSHVQNFLPLLGGKRIAIVRAAHLMTRPAANKLLKILEEPPPTAYIFLTSTSYRQLLPTVTSRCFHFLLKEEGDAPRSSFAEQFEQLLAAHSWAQHLPVLKKLRENKCPLQDFLFFYEQHLNQHYRAVLTNGDKPAHAAAVHRTRLHNIKFLLQQRISLNTQLGIESLLASWS